MTTLIHEGKRPLGRLVAETECRLHKRYKGCMFEEMEDGGYRVWTKKMLSSGCNKAVETIKEIDGLTYCPHCGEFFSDEEFCYE